MARGVVLSQQRCHARRVWVAEPYPARTTHELLQQVLVGPGIVPWLVQPKCRAVGHGPGPHIGPRTFLQQHASRLLGRVAGGQGSSQLMGEDVHRGALVGGQVMKVAPVEEQVGVGQLLLSPTDEVVVQSGVEVMD